MIINVTKKDIERGKPGRSRCCPIALAFTRKIRMTDIYVQRIYVLRRYVKADRRYFLPEGAISFIRDFDAGREVKPMRFEI